MANNPDQTSQTKAPGTDAARSADRLTAAAPGERAATEGITKARPAHGRRKWIFLAAAVIALAIAAYYVVPWLITALNTVSTDDAYVNGHVTYVAPRVAGQVAKVLVDDNYRVKKGDVLVELDKEPYQVQVSIKKAAIVL